jgi:beta-exotoxin I transport system ATP-binding protein
MSGANPFECHDLAKRYGSIDALSGVDIVVPPGTAVGFLGPNGAGKTTLIRIAMGMLRPTRGTASLYGIDCGEPRARTGIGYMPADPVFFPALTGRANLDLFAQMQGADPIDRDWAESLLDLGDDVLDRRAGTYSSGMRQKLGIIQAVQHRPRLVVLDEPANRLDPLAHRAFETVVREIATSGRSVLLSSHTLSEVEQVCDAVVMIDRGRVLLEQSAAALTARALRRVHIRYRTPPANLPSSLPPQLIDPVVTDHVVDARLPANQVDVLRTLLAGDVEDLLVEPAGLEDVFFDLYRQDRQDRPDRGEQ